MQSGWIIQRGEQQFPVADVGMLRDWATRGNIAPNDQIWSPLMGEWRVARDVSEISHLIVRPSAAVAVPAINMPVAVSSVGIRVAAYLIDLIPAILLGLIAIIPIIGQFFAGVFLGCYWLLRDVRGASLGKLMLGLKVVRADGQPATTSARIKRNVPLCIGHFLLAIPILGYVIGGIVSFIAFVIEVIMLLTQGNRMGDNMAGTTVVRK